MSTGILDILAAVILAMSIGMYLYGKQRLAQDLDPADAVVMRAYTWTPVICVPVVIVGLFMLHGA